MDKNKIAALLESLCERPLAGESPGRPHDLQDTAGAGAQPRARLPGEPMAGPPALAFDAVSGGPNTIELAAVLSGTAADAQAQAFQRAAAQSAAIRLDAQSALAFVDGLDQAPLAAPPHLVEEVLAVPAVALAAAAPRPGIWTRLLGAPRRQVVAALALLLTAGGVSWPLLRQDEPLRPAGVAAPTAPPAGPDAASIMGAPIVLPAPLPLPSAPLGGAATPPAAPPAAFAPRSAEAPAGAPLALADPCASREVPNPASAQSAAKGDAAKLSPSPPTKMVTAAVEPTCPPDQDRSLLGLAPAERPAETSTTDNLSKPSADQGTVRASRRASRAAGVDRDQSTTTAPLAVPRRRPAPASPTMVPNAAFAPVR